MVNDGVSLHQRPSYCDILLVTSELIWYTSMFILKNFPRHYLRE